MSFHLMISTASRWSLKSAASACCSSRSPSFSHEWISMQSCRIARRSRAFRSLRTAFRTMPVARARFAAIPFASPLSIPIL
jgi:hypothetical protein